MAFRGRKQCETRPKIQTKNKTVERSAGLFLFSRVDDNSPIDFLNGNNQIANEYFFSDYDRIALHPPLRQSVSRIKNNTNVRFFIINYERKILNCSVFVFREMFFQNFS